MKHQHLPLSTSTCGLYRANVRAICAACGDVVVRRSGFRPNGAHYIRWTSDTNQATRNAYWRAMIEAGRA